MTAAVHITLAIETLDAMTNDTIAVWWDDACACWFVATTAALAPYGRQIAAGAPDAAAALVGDELHLGPWRCGSHTAVALVAALVAGEKVWGVDVWDADPREDLDAELVFEETDMIIGSHDECEADFRAHYAPENAPCFALVQIVLP